MSLMTLIALLGCPPATDVSDDTGDTEADADTDADSDTDTDTDADTDAPHTKAVLTTSDYSTGALAEFDLATGTLTDTVADIDSDSDIYSSGGDLLQLGRGDSYLRVYTPGSYSAPETEFSVADNPWAAEHCGDDVWVASYDNDQLYAYSAETGTLSGTVDLSAYSDDDGSPEAGSLVVLGDTLYVGLNQLDGNNFYSALGPGVVVEVDCATRAETNSWEVGPNAFVQAWPGHDDQILVKTGTWGSLTGQIRALKPSDGSLVDHFTESDETIYAFYAGGNDTALALSADSSYAYSAWCVDLSGDEWSWTQFSTGYNYLSGGGVSDAGLGLIGESVYDEEWNPAGGKLHWTDLSSCTAGEGSPVDTTYFPTAVAFY